MFYLEYYKNVNNIDSSNYVARYYNNISKIDDYKKAIININISYYYFK